jgi:hypothetical protein
MSTTAAAEAARTGTTPATSLRLAPLAGQCMLSGIVVRAQNRGSVWNRVALLTAGLAFGWTLVHLASTPTSQVDKHRARAVLALLAGVVVVTVLGVARLTTGLLGAAVFLVACLVAYVANSKQIARPPELLMMPGPRETVLASDRVGVALVVPGEPAEYDGPAFWAQWARRRPERSDTSENVFTRPWAFSRIRNAYRAVGAISPAEKVARQAEDDLQARLGQSYKVRRARLGAQPALSSVLLALAGEGIRRFVIVRASGSAESDLWAEVSSSHVREAGARVILAARRAQDPVWDLDEDARLAEIWLGRMPRDAAAPPEEWIEATAEAVIAAAPRAAAGSSSSLDVLAGGGDGRTG